MDPGEECDNGIFNDGVTDVNGVICTETCELIPECGDLSGQTIYDVDNG